MKTILLIRGLPGSGKTTLAKTMAAPGCARLFSADDFFTSEDGEYNFDASELKSAHEECQSLLKMALTNDCTGTSLHIVHNTFSQRWEMEPYLNMGDTTFPPRMIVVDLFDGGQSDEELAAWNIHDVPVESITAMRARWEHDWSNGNPLPPWERRPRAVSRTRYRR